MESFCCFCMAAEEGEDGLFGRKRLLVGDVLLVSDEMQVSVVASMVERLVRSLLAAQPQPLTRDRRMLCVAATDASCAALAACCRSMMGAC